MSLVNDLLIELDRQKEQEQEANDHSRFLEGLRPQTARPRLPLFHLRQARHQLAYLHTFHVGVDRLKLATDSCGSLGL